MTAYLQALITAAAVLVRDNPFASALLPTAPKEEAEDTRTPIEREHRFILPTGTVFDNDFNHPGIILVEKITQAWSGQCWAHCLVSGEPDTISPYGNRLSVGDAELCNFNASADLSFPEREEEDDVQGAMDRHVDLPDINWEHLKGLSDSREMRLQRALLTVAEAEVEDNTRLVVKMAQWARKQSFCAIFRSHGSIRKGNPVNIPIGELAEADDTLGEGLEYRRYATLMNACTEAYSRMTGVDITQLGKPFNQMAIRPFPQKDKVETDGDMLDVGCRAGEFLAERVAAPSPRDPRPWFSAKYIPTPRGITTYRNPEYFPAA